MAAITFASSPVPYSVLRNVSAQATTGQTDWLITPAWANLVLVTFNLTANAGTTPTSIITLRGADPVSLDDTNDHAIFLTSATITAASFHSYTLGPTLTTAGTDSATADSTVVQNGPIPAHLGVRVLNDRAEANETYTYTLTALFRG